MTPSQEAMQKAISMARSANKYALQIDPVNNSGEQNALLAQAALEASEGLKELLTQYELEWKTNKESGYEDLYKEIDEMHDHLTVAAQTQRMIERVSGGKATELN